MKRERTLKSTNGGKRRRAATLGLVLGAATLGAVASANDGIRDAEPNVATCAPPVSVRSPNAPFARLIDEMRRADGWKTFEASGSFATGNAALEFEATFDVGVGDEFPLAAPRDAAVETAPTAVCSRWARFKPGSWTRLRTTSVAYENGKTIRSVTETKATLVSVDVEKGEYVLRFDATIKMGGLDYERKSRTARYDFCDVPLGEGDVVVETLAPVNLMIARKAIPCQTRRVTRTTPRWKETTTLWFSPVVAPHVLQKETIRESVGADGGTISRELAVVQKTAAHLLLGGELTTYAASSSAQKGERFDSTTTVYSTTTPGGIARKTTIETDANGVVLLSSTTAALDYYVAP
ncbi:MAG: hypothetical protein IKU86_05190 [Thermoguttaceae bacterium]|nr:hypothetical protein [Thermoguttaceae bacterium]